VIALLLNFAVFIVRLVKTIDDPGSTMNLPAPGCYFKLVHRAVCTRRQHSKPASELIYHSLGNG